MPDVIKILNIEEGMPSVEEARQILANKFRPALRKSLTNRKKEGLIKAFVPGEEWSIFEPGAREIIGNCPDLSKDSDLEKGNWALRLFYCETFGQKKSQLITGRDHKLINDDNYIKRVYLLTDH